MCKFIGQARVGQYFDQSDSYYALFIAHLNMHPQL